MSEIKQLSEHRGHEGEYLIKGEYLITPGPTGPWFAVYQITPEGKIGKLYGEKLLHRDEVVERFNVEDEQLNLKNLPIYVSERKKS